MLVKLLTSTRKTERVIEKWVEVPFVPFAGLIFNYGQSESKIEEVTWNHNKESFLVMLAEVSEDLGDELIDDGWVLNS